jgi:hypothetical protein
LPLDNKAIERSSENSVSIWGYPSALARRHEPHREATPTFLASPGAGCDAMDA